MNNNKKGLNKNRLEDRFVTSFYERVFERLVARSNNLGRLSRKETNRILSLAHPFSKAESDQLLEELQELGLLQITERTVYLKKVKV